MKRREFIKLLGRRGGRVAAGGARAAADAKVRHNRVFGSVSHRVLGIRPAHLLTRPFFCAPGCRDLRRREEQGYCLLPPPSSGWAGGYGMTSCGPGAEWCGSMSESS